MRSHAACNWDFTAASIPVLSAAVFMVVLLGVFKDSRPSGSSAFTVEDRANTCVMSAPLQTVPAISAGKLRRHD